MGRQLLKILNKVFPVLRYNAKKGQNGRIGVIGGSFEFTGAPFYSAISALKVGADLAHIFCSKSSAPSIKSYSPQIIAHPVFISDEQINFRERENISVKQMHKQWLDKINAWKKAINSWVIGPGLGRDIYMLQFFPQLIKNFQENSLLIFDADGIYYLSQYPQLFQQLKKHRTIITPNWRQLELIRKHININIQEIREKNQLRQDQQIRQIFIDNSHLHFQLLIKGNQDIILGKKSFIVNTKGGLKRCGGMGDILAGATAACAFWDFDYGPAMASRLVRLATRQAFKKQGRGLTAPCVVRQLAATVAYIGVDHF